MEFDCNLLRVVLVMLLVLLFTSVAAAKKDTNPANYPLVAHVVSVSISRVHLTSRESSSVGDNSSGREYRMMQKQVQEEGFRPTYRKVCQ